MGKVTIYLDLRLWHAFLVACVQRKTSASHEMRRLIQEQLAAWNTEAQQETDHAHA